MSTDSDGTSSDGSPGNRPPDAALLETLARAPRADRRGRLTDWLCALLVDFLGFDADEEVAPDETFPDLGFDSLRAVDFKLLLEERLDCRLESTLLFDCPTPAALVDYLAAVLRLDDADAAAPAVARAAAAPDEPIAIVGLACRFPGGADSPEAFWRLQREGRDAIREVPPERWAVDAFYDPDPEAPGRMYTRHGGWIDGLERFDAAFFGVSATEAAQLDPQQRVLLECAWEALERAGIPAERLRGTDVGVFIGNRGADYFQGQTDWRPEDARSYYATGNSASTLAGRVSYFLGLTGPCFALDTACSSSLVALHQAVRSLRAGESSAALVGGVNAVLDPFGTISICKAQMLSPDGRCKTFDASADGYVRSEGCGVVVLKTLSAARADGDRVLALVRGTAIGQDGASGGLTVPSRPAQVRVIRAALADAGLEPGAIDYVEAHGTGTSLGDPIEVGALDDVFAAGRAQPLLVGSVKTNIGHCEPAAGIAGLIKLVLALNHEALPAHLHLDRPSPHIPWDTTVVRVTREATAWPRGPRPRRGGVSSFGFSGTNAHAVLEEAPAPEPAVIAPRRPSHVLCLSAKSDAALRALAAAHRERRTGDVEAWCAAAALGRAALPVRAALVASDASELDGRLDAVAAGTAIGAVSRAPARAPRVAFVFTGQGSQYAGMARELHAIAPAFRAALERAEAALAPHFEVPLRELLWGARTERLARTDATQPALFGLGYALAELWRSLGVEPTWVLGHSVGEYAAAVVAGVLDLGDAAALVAARGRLMVEHTAPGAMLEVLTDEAELAPWLAPRAEQLGVAAVNCEARVVVSGARDAVADLARELDAAGHRHRALDVSHAFHSPLMAPMLDAFAECVRGVALRPPTLGFRSCLDPAADAAAFADPDYWVRHVREPVRFHDGMRALAADGAEVLIELGPTPVLLGLARRFLDDERLRFVPSLREGRSDARTFAEALAAAWTAGVPVDWRAWYADGPARATDLPTYPFQRERHWIDAARGPRAAAAAHPLLGERLDVATAAPGTALFAHALSATEPAFLDDHRAAGRVVFPAAGYVELFLAALAELGADGPRAVDGLTIEAPLFLGDGATRIQVAVGTPTNGTRTVELFARAEDAAGWRRHASATVRAIEVPPALAPPGDDRGHGDSTDGNRGEELASDSFYAALAARGLGYGPAFRTVRELTAGAGACRARVAVDAGAERRARRFGLDPALLDGCLQTVGALLPDVDDGALFLPIGIESLELYADGATQVRSTARLVAHEDDARVAVDLTLTAPDGAPVARVRGLQLVRADPAALLARESPLDALGHVLRWRSAAPAPPAEGPARRWLLVGGDALAEPLAATLEARGGAVERVAGAAVHALDADGWRARLDAARPEEVVCLWALAERADGAALERALALVEPLPALARALEALEGPAPRLTLVTRGAVAAGPGASLPDVDAATLWGVGAALELEQPGWRATRLDLDPGLHPDVALGADAAADAARIADELTSAAAERQVAWRGAQRRVARLVPWSDARRDVALAPPRAEAWHLRAAEYGVLERLECRPAPRRAPGPGEVEVALEAAALNFKDVLFALGLLRGFTGIERAEEQPLGLEGAGRVARVGAGVRGLAVGDAVLVSAADTLASHVVAPVGAVARRPAGTTVHGAAALPTVFMTALHALENVARLGAGERVLIHAAAGGVGLAALQVARRAGAEVFATASRAKHAHLRALGVEHVFDSRGLDYADGVRAATGGRGVDVVLDSLAGDHVAASLECLAEGGRLVEIGKLDVWSDERLRAARPDVAYAQFDLADSFAEDPALQTALLGALTAGFERGDFAPLPTRVFDLADAVAGFRALAQGQSIGKLVVDLPPVRAAALPPAVRPDRSYVITGGLGALGLHIARHLAERGAGELLLLGRSAPGPEARTALEDLRAGGTRVATAAVDAADGGALAKALDALDLPMGGAVHAAGVLADGLLSGADRARFERVLAPKVAGAEALAEAVDARGAEWLVHFSSLAAMVGSPGQSAYAAANAWLDAQASRRAARGAHTVAIAWGPWRGGGMAARTDERRGGQLAAHGLRPIAPGLGAALFEAIVAGPREPRVGAFAVDWERWTARYAGAVPPFFEALTGGADADAAADDARLAAELAAAPAAERPARVREALCTQLARVLGLASADRVDPAAPFVDLGIDSLLAVELRHRLETTFACTLPATLVLDYPDCDALAGFVASLLDERLAGDRAADAALEAELADLSDEEVARLLADGDGEGDG